MDKFKLKPEPASCKSFKSVIVDADTHQLLSELKDETGISIARLIAGCVRFALDHLEVEED